MALVNTTAAPISWTPSSYWDGNDGLWNTFIVEVGSPPQGFRILPSTAGQETWLPNIEGCQTASPSDPGYCGYLRGALPFHGANSSGFQTNESSTWDLIGIYKLDAQEAELGYTGNGLYGFDTVTLNGTSETVSQKQQVVASTPDLDYWLGYFGLGPKTINFTTFDDPIENYMQYLVGNGTIPSLSWGYTAGAHYHSQAPASLTLGGYDTDRFTSSDLTIQMNADNSRPLQVAIQKIIAEGSLGGAGISLLPEATYHFIDSTLPHIWLPDAAIDLFVQNFGLTYDNATDLFLINDTMRQTLIRNSAAVTFVLSNSTLAGDTLTQNIVLPYAAFDLQASYPFYQNATNYFPIRRAANESQYTIGRTFLQEAYLIADFERNNFTVAQASFDNLNTQHLVAIQKPVATNSTTDMSPFSNSSPGLSGGAMAGIAVGAIVALALVALLVFFIRRSKKRKHQPVPTSDPEKPVESHPDRKDLFQVSEAPSDAALVEAPGQSKGHKASELPSLPTNVEMEGDLGKSRARPGMHEMDSGRSGERRYELMGSQPAGRL